MMVNFTLLTHPPFYTQPIPSQSNKYITFIIFTFQVYSVFLCNNN